MSDPQKTTPTVDVWFDPVCPFTWVTTRWLLTVAEHRPIDLRWHLMSLAVLNEGVEMDDEYAAEMVSSRRIGRLLAATVDRHGPAKLPEIYTALGALLHPGERELDADCVAEALAACGADADLAATLDDERFDAAVAASHQAGQDLLGGDGGSPLVAVDGQAFFGPVVMTVPEPEAAAELFDAIALLAATPAFRMIQRPYSDDLDLG